MTKQSDHDTEGLRDRPVLIEGFCEKLNYALHQSDLLAKRSQHLLARNWYDRSKDYADGYRLIYLRVRATRSGGIGEQESFSFLIGADKVWIAADTANRIYSAGIYKTQSSKSAARDIHRMGSQSCCNPHQILPMLILVGDLVHGPEQVIPSRVWFLGKDEIPLIGREFLFEDILSASWKRFTLPICPETPEWEAYARNPATVALDYRNKHFIESGSDVADRLDDLPSNIFGRGVFDACNYVRSIVMYLTPNAVSYSVSNPLVEKSFDVAELAFSTPDLFQ